MWKRLRIAVSFLLTLALVFDLGAATLTKPASAADSYDLLREKWKSFLTGGSYSLSDPDVAAVLANVTAEAQNDWNTLNTSAARTYLWNDLNDAGAAASTKSSYMTLSYQRLEDMALAYSMYGSSLYHDSALLTDIVDGLDWLYTNKYNSGSAKVGNWFDWEIGTPLTLNNTTALLYDQLTSAQVANYMAVVDFFNPTVTMTGANRVWESTVIGIRGILVKDSAKITAAQNGLTGVFDYVTSSDGFYADGSFIQHGKYPYTGGYGSSLVGNLVNIVYLLSGSAWEVTTPGMQNMYNWIYDSFEPLIYKGAMMDMVRGRNVSRRTSQDHTVGGGFIKSVMQMAQFAPAADAANFKSMVKYWIQSDTSRSFFANANSIYHLQLARNIVNDAAVVPRGEPVGYRNFAAMDRIVQRRPDFGFAISMSSKRIYNYESLNNENLKGWYTGDGMTYLYKQDLVQYSDEYWGLVNKYRLPGTTVDTQSRTNQSGTGYLSSKSWVGGSVAAGVYGSAGMELEAYGSSLTARKSWFSFADKIVALGAGINSTDGRTIETTVENRKINAAGSNALTVNGTAKASSLGWSETMSGVNRIHLQGDAPGSDIGYYFPGGATVKGLREARTGSWQSVNTYAKMKDSTVLTRNFMTLWLDHGANPAGGTYAYVILPNKTSAQLDNYAANPDVSSLENSEEAQAVRDRSIQAAGFNFWNNVTKTVYDSGSPYLTSSTKASVSLLEAEGGVEIGISDPTQANTGAVELELHKAASSVLSADPGVTVVQLQPTVKLRVNVSGAKGKTFQVKLQYPESGGDWLVNENFDAMTTGTAPTGWTLNTAGGVIDIVNDPSTTNKSMRLFDTSTTSAVHAKKAFTASAAPVTVEFKVKLGTPQSLYYMQLLSGSTTAVRLRTFQGMLQVMNGTSYKDLQPYSPNTWYTIRIEAAPATDKANIYVDGVLRQSQGSFEAAVSSLDTVQFLTHSTTSNMTMLVDDLRVNQ